MKKVVRIPTSTIATTLMALTLFACSSSPQRSAQAPLNQPLSAHEQTVNQSFMQVYEQWKGVPYRLGGNSYSGIDCSAFVQIAYRDALELSLPRTTKAQVKLGAEIDYQDAQVGDLAFFKTSWNVRHVGVYVGNKRFMHASTSKGVIISRLDNPYWASKFWHFRRIETPPT